MNPKEIIAGSILGTAIVISANEVAVQHTAPRPRQFVAAWVVFLMLSGATMFGPGPAKVASYLAVVTFLGVLVAPDSVTMLIKLGTFFGAPTPEATPTPSPGKA